MKQLYAPWRQEYTTDVTQTKSVKTTENDCIFCQQFKEQNDDVYFIIRRFDGVIVMLNKFPYNAGHMLILPINHHASLHELSSEIRAKLMELTMHSIEIVKKALKCDGVNVGINLGKAAGAGIPSHLHMHVLPRFTGDTNFLPTLADTKTIS